MRHTEVYVCGSFGGADHAYSSQELKKDISERNPIPADPKRIGKTCFRM